MAGVSMVSQFPTNSVSAMSPYPKLSSKFSKLMGNSMRFPVKNSVKPKLRFTRRIQNKFNFALPSVSGEEAEPETKEPEITDSVAVAVAEVEVEVEPTEIGSLKKQLVDALYGTHLGLSATSETTAEILELITLLEAKNPTPAPTEALPLLNGKWILAYTSFVDLYPLLSKATLPVVTVEEISQTIDSETFTVQNCVVFSGLGSKTSISTNATFEVKSRKRVQIKFDEGIIGTPQLTDSIELPVSVEILGQIVDLTPFQGLITSVQDTASSVAKSISNRPPLKFSIPQTHAESWLLTTYLDEELRISRGDGGKVFVLFKEGSSLLLP